MHCLTLKLTQKDLIQKHTRTYVQDEHSWLHKTSTEHFHNNKCRISDLLW